MKYILFIALFISIYYSAVSLEFKSLEEKVNYYKDKFKVNCLDEKITDNKGNGFDDLYGTRNMRTVLYGIAYRGGANNFYHISDKRENQNPLPADGLQNLCNLGFSEAIYLYSKNYKESQKEFVSKKNKLIYEQNSLNNKEEVKKFLLQIKSVIDNPNEGPIYFHCWNGWHQAGFAGATILMQFCDYSSSDAYQYWVKNTDGAFRGYDNVKNAVKLFVPFDDIKIDKKTKELICPCMNSK
ncbi:MAG TPA: hypothetical protein PLE30_05020 [Candidatus Kapabacteria bacterium]|nr:hypothetical protein [Candidatus Kapabacteria bacterium]